MFKNILLVIGGALAGYIYTHHQLDKKYYDDLQREIMDIKDRYDRKDRKRQQEALKASEALKSYAEGKPADSEANSELKKSLLEHASEDPKVGSLVSSAPKKTDYNAISTPKGKNKEEKSGDTVKIELISQEDYMESGEPQYKQYSVSYFLDDVLANESDKPITGDALTASLGTTILDRLKTGEDHKNGTPALFVRNVTYGWEFEIVFEDRKYSEMYPASEA